MIFPENLQLLTNLFLKPCATQVIVECEIVEYEYLILDIFATWRVSFKNFKNIATILSVLYALKIKTFLFRKIHSSEVLLR